MGIKRNNDKLNLDIEKYGFTYREGDSGIKNLLNKDIKLSKLQKDIISNRLTIDDLNDFTLTEFIYGTLYIDKGMKKLTDVYKGGELIATNMRENKHICIVCDFDADGISSATVFYKSLVEVMGYPKENISVIINHRRDGNGYTMKLVDRILKLHKEKAIDLIVSGDHGSSDEDRFKILKDNNIQLVITDHHQIPKDSYPVSPDVFINNQREDSSYSEDVSGCFIAFITMIATYKAYKGIFKLSKFKPVLPNVAISTISDSMPLNIPLNRLIVNLGLKELNSLRSKPWMAIKKILGIPTTISANDIGFKIGPLINSANRVGNEELAFKLLIATDYKEAYIACEALQKLNTIRKNGQKALLKLVKKDIDRKMYNHSVVMLIETNLAINGVIASNIGDQEKVPTVCFNKVSGDQSILSGSGRGNITGINLLEIFKSIEAEDKNILIKYGGHHGAAGCAIHDYNYNRFKELFNKYSKIQMDKLYIETKICIDSYIPPSLITPSLIKSLYTIGPYGSKFDKPILLTKIRVSMIGWYGSFVKLKFITDSGRELNGMLFVNGYTSFNEETVKKWKYNNTQILLAFTIDLDSFLGGLDIMIKVIDMKEIL